MKNNTEIYFLFYSVLAPFPDVNIVNRLVSVF